MRLPLGRGKAPAVTNQPGSVPRPSAAYDDSACLAHPVPKGLPNMPAPSRVVRILHLAQDPNETLLLHGLLEAEGLECTIDQVADAQGFADAVRAGELDLVVADLPLPWAEAQTDLAELQRRHPEWPVIFRWGESGTWSVEEPGAQLARAMQKALAGVPVRAQNEAERRALLDRLVHQQDVLLRLSQRPNGDFPEFVHEVTETLSALLDVERVSVWESDLARTSLRCLDLFVRSRRSHEEGQVLRQFPRYARALDSALSVAAHDARSDPRTSEFRDSYLVPMGISSMLDAPIRRGGTVTGVVCIEHVGAPRHWTLLDQCAATGAANLLARACEVRDRRALEERVRQGERLEAIGHVAARVAHDFGNRLTAIGGMADIAASELPGDAPAREPLRRIHEEVEKASQLVRQLLALGRPPHAGESEAVASVDLSAVIARLLPVVRGVVGSSVRVEFEGAGAPLPVRIDPRDVEHVLLNLASNARDAMPHGGTLRLETQAVPATRVVRLVVADEGVGISEQARRHLFEPFYTTKPGGLGTGLGLASVHDVVRRAGGEIQVRSAPGMGTRFEILLPMA